MKAGMEPDDCEDPIINELLKKVQFVLGDVDRRLTILEYKIHKLENKGIRA